ncbi:monocarboxylate transporter 9-like [Dermacentor andersoni]|uniref:monocarboxylate transporter 9-like n=1 Tax=Dermacentor andersoni TaxID=34620 RepID=UPI003B3ADE29
MAGEVMGHKNVVVDSCWTLLPLSALLAMLASMINKNSGLFYVAFMDQFGASRQTASLLVTLLQKKLSTYQIAVSGCLLNFTGLVASAFAPTAVWMTITLGVVVGVGYGMIVLSLSIYAMVYFHKYRGTASGFKYTGMTLAPIAFPLALSALIRAYELSGTLLLLSAITLHTLPLAMLMNNPRPVTFCCSQTRRLFRDTMGSYDNLYRMMSALYLVFAIVLFIFAFMEKRVQKRLGHN